jgi:tRNA-(ms[2]io[6]A)-hydroxylase
MVSEAGHYVTFIELARSFQNVDLVNVRWQEWLNFEA